MDFNVIFNQNRIQNWVGKIVRSEQGTSLYLLVKWAVSGFLVWELLRTKFSSLVGDSCMDKSHSLFLEK